MSTTTPADDPIAHDAIDAPPTLALEAQTRGEVDVQITTARRYPRSVRQFLDEALAMATLDEDTAAGCLYALPRDGKTIDGPSVRLAEICASAWGHLRVQARVVSEDDRFITARGEAWDIQRNVAIAFEVRRRVTDKRGKHYSDDMVATTGNAASSIALRNAIFRVIPKAFWHPIYLKCREVAVGKAETLANKRAEALAYFVKMGATNDRVLAALGVRGVEDIGLEHLATLRGLATAIKDGATSVDEAFPAAPAAVLPMPTRLSERPPAAPVVEAPPEAAPLVIDRVRAAEARGTGAVAATEGGLKLWTKDAELGGVLLTAVDRLVSIVADPPDAAGRRRITALAFVE